MAKQFRNTLGHVLRTKCSEPLSSIPYREAVEGVLLEEEVEEDSAGFRKDGKPKVVAQIQTAFRWLRAQGYGHSKRKGHWSLTAKGWQHFAPEMKEDTPDELWEWITKPRCWGFHRADLDTCKACLCQPFCREVLHTHLYHAARTLELIGEEPSDSHDADILRKALKNEVISRSEFVVYSGVLLRLDASYQTNVSPERQVCYICHERIPPGIPYVLRRNTEYHILCATRKESK